MRYQPDSRPASLGPGTHLPHRAAGHSPRVRRRKEPSSRTNQPDGGSTLNSPSFTPHPEQGAYVSLTCDGSGRRPQLVRYRCSVAWGPQLSDCGIADTFAFVLTPTCSSIWLSGKTWAVPMFMEQLSGVGCLRGSQPVGFIPRSAFFDCIGAGDPRNSRDRQGPGGKGIRLSDASGSRKGVKTPVKAPPGAPAASGRGY